VLTDSGGTKAIAVAEEPSLEQKWLLQSLDACQAVLSDEPKPDPSPSATAVAIPAALVMAGFLYLRRRPLLALMTVSIGAAAFIGYMTSSASAHCAGGDCGFDWYTEEWKATHHTGLNITWRFAAGFPDGHKRDRVREAFGRWNFQGQQMQFEQLGEEQQTVESCEAPNGIFYFNVTPIAYTDKCSHNPINSTELILHGFDMLFDSSQNWYGHPDPSNIGSSEWDFEGIAQHESGHATGFAGQYNDHFDEDGDLCPGTSDRHTMCGGSSVVLGQGWYRSLEEHDKHTFDNAYPDQ
jgi:hypothetical protein